MSIAANGVDEEKRHLKIEHEVALIQLVVDEEDDSVITPKRLILQQHCDAILSPAICFAQKVLQRLEESECTEPDGTDRQYPSSDRRANVIASSDGAAGKIGIGGGSTGVDAGHVFRVVLNGSSRSGRSG